MRMEKDGLRSIILLHLQILMILIKWKMTPGMRGQELTIAYLTEMKSAADRFVYMTRKYRKKRSPRCLLLRKQRGKDLGSCLTRWLQARLRMEE